MTLGEIIINYRNEHGLSQRQFAERCKGITNGYISMLENGKNPTTNKPISPKLDKLKCLADGMGMSLNDLLAMADDMPVDLAPSEPNEADFNTFTLQVEDDSMYPCLQHGDTLTIHRQAEADSGQIAAVLFAGKTLICRVYRVSSALQLVWDNAAKYPPRLVPFSQIHILGRAVEMKRML